MTKENKSKQGERWFFHVDSTDDRLTISAELPARKLARVGADVGAGLDAAAELLGRIIASKGATAATAAAAGAGDPVTVTCGCGCGGGGCKRTQAVPAEASDLGAFLAASGWSLAGDGWRCPFCSPSAASPSSPSAASPSSPSDDLAGAGRD